MMARADGGPHRSIPDERLIRFFSSTLWVENAYLVLLIPLTGNLL